MNYKKNIVILNFLKYTNVNTMCGGDYMLYTNKDHSTTMITRARRNTLGDLLTRTAVKYPDKWAFTFKSRKVTYKQLDDLVNQTAHGLIQDGVVKGDQHDKI